MEYTKISVNLDRTDINRIREIQDILFEDLKLELNTSQTIRHIIRHCEVRRISSEKSALTNKSKNAKIKE